MCEDECGGVEENGAFEDFSWMNEGFSHVSHGDMIDADECVFGIQKEAVHMFSVLIGEDRHETGVDAFRGIIVWRWGEVSRGFLDETDGIAGNRVESAIEGHDRGLPKRANDGSTWSEENREVMCEQGMQGMGLIAQASGVGEPDELVPVNAIDMELIGVCLERMDV